VGAFLLKVSLMLLLFYHIHHRNMHFNLKVTILLLKIENLMLCAFLHLTRLIKIVPIFLMNDYIIEK